MLTFWLVLAGVFLVIEAATTAMCSIWFAAEALVATIVSALGGTIWLQILAFVLVSTLCLIILYPKLKHLVSHNHHPTNTDMLIGQTCPVTQRIDNLAETGAVKIAGKVWTARAEDGNIIEENTIVRIKRICGAKMIVTPYKQDKSKEA